MVTRTVMASPAHTVAHTTPAQYKTVTVQMQIAPARTAHSYTPPTIDYVNHPITLKGPTVRAIHHPAEVVPAGHRRWHR
jgi:hypothetical protein